MEFERAEVQSFSVACIPTYNFRLSVCVGGGDRDRSTSICVGKERDLAMY